VFGSLDYIYLPTADVEGEVLRCVETMGRRLVAGLGSHAERADEFAGLRSLVVFAGDGLRGRLGDAEQGEPEGRAGRAVAASPQGRLLAAPSGNCRIGAASGIGRTMPVQCTARLPRGERGAARPPLPAVGADGDAGRMRAARRARGSRLRRSGWRDPVPAGRCLALTERHRAGQAIGAAVRSRNARQPRACRERSRLRWGTRPALSSDGSALFFMSDRPGGSGGVDL